MALFNGAPISNNGYYDIPINNQYSNQNMYNNHPIKTNQYRVNKNINNTINNNNDSYIVYQEPTIPSNSLYIESDTDMSNYYNEQNLSLSNNKIPLMKKKEMTFNGNNIDYIENFNGTNRFLDPVVYGRGGSIGPNSGYMLGPGRNINNQDNYVKVEQNNSQIQTYVEPVEMNNSDNYWSYNDPGYTNYYFVPEYKTLPQQNYPQQNYPQQNYPQQNYPQQQMIPILPISHVSSISRQQRIIPIQNIPEIKHNQKKILKKIKKKIIKDDKVKIKLLKEDIQEIKLNLKDKNINKKKYDIDKKTLWTIITIMSIIIFLFFFKTLYDYKVIRFISK